MSTGHLIGADFLIKYFLKFLWELYIASHISLWFSCNSMPNVWALSFHCSILSLFLTSYTPLCFHSFAVLSGLDYWPSHSSQWFPL
jgi:hypothetical protein